MKYFLSIVLAMAWLGCSKPAPAPQMDSFGKGVTMSEVTPIAQAVAQVGSYKDKEILIESEIKSVCQKKGCWMEIATENQPMRITFENYGFFVPKDAAGRKVKVQGKIEEKEIPQDEARHYLEDAGKPKEEIEKIVGPQKVVTMVASGVAIVK
ncbi:DUF4920 domain-containing protein [bacterium]|nr:DUF4920 domain-containing protein [bacterium]NUN46490.1 DUF4920 domain-containing protein [bacterium]